jgi:hypothetical protein
MAFITAETRSDLIELAVAMLKQAPSAALLDELIALSTDGGSLADAADHIAKTDAFKAEYPSFQTAEQYATEIFDNITTGGTIDAGVRELVIELATSMLVTGTVSKAGLALEIAKVLSDPATLLHPDFADIAQSFQNRADAAEYFVVTKELGGSTAAELAAAIASVTSDAATLTAANAAADATASAEEVVPGQTFTLTTGLDTGSSFTGGTGNDTFSAIESSTTPVSDSLTAGDSLVGGEGTDTLVVAVSGNVATTAGVATTGIEAASIYNNNAAQDYTLDATLMSGLTDIYVNGGTDGSIVSAVGSLPNLHLTSTSQDATVTATAAATAGDADEVTIASNASALTSSATATYNGIETINLAVAGATGTGGLTNYRLNLASDALETINVTGAANAYVAATFTGAAADSQTSTFDASAATGNVTVDFTRGASATSAVTMGAGNDHVDFLSTLSEKDVIVGGEGTDTFEIGGTNDYGLTAATQDNGSGISGFEVLRLKSAAVVDARILTNNDAITNVVFEAGGSYTDSAVTDATNLSSGTVVLDLATDSAADSLNFTAAGVGAITSTLTALDMETINVTTGGLGNVGLTISGATADVTKVVAAGTQSLNLTVAGTSIATVDASGVTGLGESFTLSATASTADMTVTPSGVTPSDADADTANSITTGAGDDTLTGTAYIDILTGGAGADTITGGGGLDQLNGGAGNDSITGGADNDAISDGAGDDVVSAGDGIDTITLGAGSDSIDGGAGNDVITAGSNLSSGDTIVGGTGTDALTATISGVGIAPTISGTESISLGFGASTYVDMANVTDVSSLVLDSATAGGAAVQVKNLISGATITVTDEASLAGAGDLTTLTVDTAADATVGVKIAANANAAIAAATSIGAVTFTDAASVAFTNVGGSADNVLDHQITGNIVLDDTDTTSLSLTSSAYGSLDFVANDVTNSSELKTLTVSAASYGDITLDNIDDAEELQTITITAAGESADVIIDDIGTGTASTALTSISLAATSGGTIDTGIIDTTANLSTVSVTADGTNSNVTSTGIIDTNGGSISQVTIAASDRGTVDMTGQDLTVTTGLISALSVSATGRGTVDLDGFTATSAATGAAGAFSITTGTRGTITMGNADISTDGNATSITVTVGEDSTLSAGTGVITAAGTITDTVVSVAADAVTSGTLTVGQVDAVHTDAAVTLSADATNGATIDLIGATFTALDYNLGGSANITQAYDNQGTGQLELTYDGTASAVKVFNDATEPTITSMVVNAGTSSGTNSWDSTLASKLTYTGGSGADRVIGTAGADTITGGAGDDVIYNAGRTETYLIATATTGDEFVYTINGVANTNVQTGTDEDVEGAAIAALINADYVATGGAIATYATATDTLTVTYGAYFGTAGAVTGSDGAGGAATGGVTVTATSTGSNAGKDVINGGSGSDVLAGGAGADSITTGSGSDDVVILDGLTNTGLSVVASATSFAAATVANGDTMTFANGVDVITDFTSGVDDLVVSQATVTFEATAPTTLIGATVADLAEDEVHGARGDYTSSTGVWTFSATGSDYLIAINDGTAADDSLITNTNVMILTGVTALVAGDFI